MTIIGAIMDKVMKRGLYRAYVNDRLITMCQDCTENLEEPNPLLKSVPVHRCRQEFNLDGTHKVLVDPYSVPSWCPHRIVDIIEPAVTR